LESYAQKFQLVIWCHQKVISARYADYQWEVQTPDHLYQSPNLVILAGNTVEPFLPSIGIGTLSLIKNGQVHVHVGIKEFTEDRVIFRDGKQAPLDAVILATGYRPCVHAFLSDLPAPVYDKNGIPFSRVSETAMPGLYFCGYYVAPTGMLREISREAKRISAGIAVKMSR